METQRELQSAAHIFYQQVVHVLKQKVQLEKQHPGIPRKKAHILKEQMLIKYKATFTKRLLNNSRIWTQRLIFCRY